MPIATTLEFPGITQDQYDEMGRVLAGGALPGGIIYHACGPIDGSWRISDIWESRELFDDYIDGCLLPAMRSIGGPEPSRREMIETYHAGPFNRS